MSITPRGMSIQEAYRLFRDDALFVNRRYQRKLVWPVNEKQLLIRSILEGYPIPLILFAERPELHGPGRYEIIDGMQRLDAIFSFIEQGFSFADEYFDLSQNARARQAAEKGSFEPVPNEDVRLLSARQCANLLDYQLAVTIYPTSSEEEITEVFRRINANGRQLSAQEKRQAGVLNPFTELVRGTASKLRGDVSPDILLLHEMPAISVESARERQHYGVRAEDTLWCSYGVLDVKQLREGEDEQVIADIATSVLLGDPLAVSAEVLDDLYDEKSDAHANLLNKLSVYGKDRLEAELETTFSVISATFESELSPPNLLRNLVRPGGRNPAKAPFYSIFMAFFGLIIEEQRVPVDNARIVAGLRDVAKKLVSGRHHITTEDRVKNIAIVHNLIKKHFAPATQPAFRHGPGLSLDFANAVRRSKIETVRYEFKQGVLALDADRTWNSALVPRLVETVCAIANSQPGEVGYLFLGVADRKAHADRVAELDGVEPEQLNAHYVVGIDREAKLLNLDLEQYVEKIVREIRASDLSEPLRSNVLSAIDTVEYHGKHIMRITIPAQREAAFVGDKAFVRENSSTVEVAGRRLAAVIGAFS
jgi:hypothetical protein